MKYIGNPPPLEIDQAFSTDRWDYVMTGNPAVDTNPSSYPVTWLNLTTGEEFICIDNTVGVNVWKGTLGTTI